MIRHKGMSLIELLVMTALLAGLMAAMTPLFGGLIKNTPQLFNDSAANMQLSKILRQIRLDALAAQTLQVNHSNETIFFNVSFTCPAKVIHYRYDPAQETLTRQEEFNNGTTSDQTNSWSLSNADFSTDVKEHGTGQLLIIHCGFKRLRAGRQQLALANTHVFCISGENSEGRP